MAMAFMMMDPRTNRAPIHDAALKCDVEGLRRCLTPEALAVRPVNARRAGGLTALHLLCGCYSPSVAMYVQTGERNAETVRAGAEISNHIRTALDTFAGPHSGTHAEGQAIFLYFQKVIDAGGFKKYEQAHLAALTATFAPKLRLPARPARLVAEYWGHAGFY